MAVQLRNTRNSLNPPRIPDQRRSIVIGELTSHSVPTLTRASASCSSVPSPTRHVKSNRKKDPKRLSDPVKTNELFQTVQESISRGIKLFHSEVGRLREDVSSLPGNERAGFHYDTDKVVKYLERLVRALESHADKVDTLHDMYSLQCKLKDGADNLACALDHRSSHGAKALAEVKQEKKEVNDFMCQLEDGLGELMGSFTIQIKGLIGFARLCSGDVFEVKVLLGCQKWKSKCKITKSGQKWSEKIAVLTVPDPPADDLLIKIVEIRTLHGKTEVGCVRCSTKSLMSLQPQNVTFKLKGSSSLRLTAEISWSPVSESDVIPYDIPKKEIVIGHVDGNTMAVPLTAVSPVENPKRIHSFFFDPQPSDLGHGHQSLERKSSVTSVESQESTLEMAYTSLCKSYDQFKGQHEELTTFEKILDELGELLKKEEAHSSPSQALERRKSLTLSVTSALHQFDFLNSEDSGPDDEEDETAEEESFLQKPNMESRVSLDSGKGHSVSSHPAEDRPKSTGSPILDQAVAHHLRCCKHLVSQLSSFGPLHYKEGVAIKKLCFHGAIIGQFLSFAASARSKLFTLEEVCPKLVEQKELRQFWIETCGENVFWVGVKELGLALWKRFGDGLRVGFAKVAELVVPEIINRVMDIGGDGEDLTLVTVHQYFNHFHEIARRGLQFYVNTVGKEVSIVEGLKSSLKDANRNALLKINELGFSALTLGSACLLLVAGSSQGKSALAGYIERLAKYPSHRVKALKVYLEAIEDTDQQVREGACKALGIMKACEAVTELTFLAKCDFVTVKEAAYNALMACGDAGRLAYSNSLPTTFYQLGPIHTLVPQVVL